MPNVTAQARQMRNGEVIRNFKDMVSTTPVTYTYPNTQEILKIWNLGDRSLIITAAGESKTLERGEMWKKVADITSFTIASTSGNQMFEAWADEKGAVFDSPEGIYFSGGVISAPGGGSGITFEDLANGETVSIGSAPEPTAPSVPTGLTATASNAQVALSWSAVSGATGYKVYRNGSLLASPTSASHTDTTAVNGTTYSYTVSATNAAGESAQTSAQTATPTAPQVAPATPSGLTATAGDTQVSLTWIAVSGATSYKVYRGGTQIATPTSASYTDTGLTNGTTYSYTVAAVNGIGDSAQSGSVSATPAPVAAGGKVDDASLTFYADSPANGATIPNPDNYFTGTGNFTLSVTAKFAISGPNAGSLLVSRWVNAAADNVMKIEFTWNNLITGSLFGTKADGTTSWTPGVSSSPTAYTDYAPFYHIVLEREGTTLKLFVNDALVQSLTILTTDIVRTISAKPLIIGESGKAATFKNVAYYNRALTAAERTQNYNALR